MQLLKQWKPLNLFLYALILSLLLHTLFLLSMGVIWLVPVTMEKPPSMEVPAYFYRDENVKSGAMPEKQVQPQEETKRADVIEKPTLQTPPKQQASQKISISKPDEEPIHLIGDKNTPPKPLAKIIGRALTKKLAYPKIAVDFRLRGIVYVGFSIHPDGTLTEIKVVQSSHAGVLDAAALEAVNAITPLQNVAAYVSKPRYLVIGIIFK